jgi:transcriptional regulator with XRE-family HTH domain
MMKKRPQMEQTPLSIFVRERLAELGVSQSEFCRLTGFDQGLLSKVQSSMVTNLTLESALRLAIGLCVSPQKVFDLLSRTELHDLIVTAYAIDMADLTSLKADELPADVLEICHMALRAHLQHHDLEKIKKALYPMAVAHRVGDDRSVGKITPIRGRDEW